MLKQVQHDILLYRHSELVSESKIKDPFLCAPPDHSGFGFVGLFIDFAKNIQDYNLVFEFINKKRWP